jgi:photosystem II stability/assembly factor-like uncharacterized protein
LFTFVGQIKQMKNYKLLPAGLLLLSLFCLFTSSCNKKVVDTTPTVLTLGVVSITTATASGSFEVLSNGYENITAAGSCYSSTNNQPTLLSDRFTNDATSTGAYNSVLTGLSENTTYYVRAYATNPSGTTYGNLVIFQTSAGWAKQISGTNTILNSIYFTDASNGYAVGNNGTILKTTNAGISWVAKSSGTTSNLNSIYFINTTTGYIVGDNGTILTTNDSSTWATQAGGTNNNLNSVYFTDANHGYAVGANGIILSFDGANWTSQTNGANNLNSVCFVGATGCAVGANGTILTTNNYGNIWVTQSGGTSNLLNSVYFTSANTGYAVGVNGTILQTNNAGFTWTAQTSNTGNELQSVYFSDANNGYAVGVGSTILATSNGGSTWSKQPGNTSNILYSVFIAGSHAYAVGGGGTILHF